jgi:hypothetical protein
MPKGPQGQKRPADAIGLAVMVGRIATGEIEDNATAGSEAQREGGKKGGAARAARLSAETKSEIARKGAAGRWKLE